jgi:hypothetical protein
MFTPRLPFAALLGLPSLPSPPPPPVFLPGLGLMSLPEAVELLAPPLTDQEVIYYQSLLELVAGGLVTVSAAVCTVQYHRHYVHCRVGRSHRMSCWGFAAHQMVSPAASDNETSDNSLNMYLLVYWMLCRHPRCASCSAGVTRI